MQEVNKLVATGPAVDVNRSILAAAESGQEELYIKEVGEMIVNQHTMKRGRLPRSSAVAGIATTVQGAAVGPSPFIKSKEIENIENSYLT